VAEYGAKKPPERVAAKPDRDQRQKHFAERLMLDRAEGALLVCDLAALTDGEVECEQSDDCV
jgi:hypothetical protein